MIAHDVDLRPVPTVGDLQDTMLGGAFEGCAHDVQLSAYIARSAFTWALRGFASGVALGVLGAGALYFYTRR